MLAGDEPPNVFTYWAVRARSLCGMRAVSPRLMTCAVGQPRRDPSGFARLRARPSTTASTTWCRSTITSPDSSITRMCSPMPGCTTLPTTWREFLAACEASRLLVVGPHRTRLEEPLAGAVLVRTTCCCATAGPEYRAKLMAGQAAYTDPEVVHAMEIWKELVDKGYFYPDANAYDWTERWRPGRQRRSRHDADGHLDHWLLEMATAWSRVRTTICSPSRLLTQVCRSRLLARWMAGC